MSYNKTEDPRSIWEQANIEGCVEWTGARDKDGYGQTRIGMKRVKVHRAIWESLFGPVPGKMLVCHSCDNPACFRPNHLFLGTHKDNQQDKWAKGRGVTHFGHKFTDDQIREIRSRYATKTIRQRELAQEFSTTQATISRIVLRKIYQEVP